MQNPNFIVQKMYNFGTSDPFAARMFLGILEIRDFIYNTEGQRKDFDKLYATVIDNLVESKEAKERLLETIKNHIQNVESGKLVKFAHNTTTIDESIDKDINKSFKDFFIKAEIAIQGLGELSKFIGFNISFFFSKNDKKFENQTEKLLLQYKDNQKIHRLIKMLRNDRQSWYTLFNDIRNQVEHKGFKLPEVRYEVDGDKVKVCLPTINHKSLEEIINLFWDNIWEFCEDSIVWLLDLKINDPVFVGIIPEDQRDPTKPIKYILSAKGIKRLTGRQKN